MKKSEISKAIDKAVCKGMTRDSSGDQRYLDMGEQTWDDLASLRDSIAQTILEMYSDISDILTSADIRNAVAAHSAEKQKEFIHLENVFHADVDRTSKMFETLRKQHLTHTGAVASMDDLVLYNKLSLEYQNVSSEIQLLLAPTITAMMLLIHEVAPTALTPNDNGVQDVTVKEPTHAE